MWSYTVLTASKTFSSLYSPPVLLFQLAEVWARAARKYLQRAVKPGSVKVQLGPVFDSRQ